MTDLLAFHGIGQAKAITIMASLELGRRRKLSDVNEKKSIAGSADVFEIFHPILADLPHEEFWIIILNTANRILDKIKISQGGIAGTVADVRLILQPAIFKSASAIVLCHNHPSGNPKPSQADIELTDKIRKAADLFNIKVLDHLIIADNKYFSFTEEGV
jgi:DNA repair protein RadC